MITFLKLIVILFATGNLQSAKRIEPEIFFKPREQTLLRISPDGQHLAYIGILNNHNNIFIKDVGTDEGFNVTDSKTDINDFSWGNNTYILYRQDNQGDENYKLYRININDKEIKCLTDYENVKTSIVSNPQSKEGNIVITMNLRDSKIFDPYSLNIITGALNLLYTNPGNLSDWMVDNSGIIRFARSNVLLYRKDNESEFREVVKLGPDDVFSPKFFTPLNDHVYAYSNINRDKTAIVEFDPDSGKEVNVLLEVDGYDTFGDDERDYFSYSQSTKKLLFARYTAEKRSLFFFDKNLERIYKALKSKIGKEYEVNFVSYSDDLTKFIVHLSSDKVEGRYYYYDIVNDILKKLCEDSPWLDENEMAEMKPISFIARDGLLIHGYLTLPKGKKAKGLPVIVNPHAGPQWRNSWVFDQRTQFLANRGYAVLQVNFRGSMGYGKDFMRKGYRQFGLRIQDDITDGVNWLIKQGIADKNRIAIFGWSFGGYATLAGVTFTPDLYTCGIDLWGMSNLFSWYQSFPPYWKSSSIINKIHERWVDGSKDSVQMDKTSPALHADKIKVPLLIFQGANDIRVKRGQSDEMVEALKKCNKEVEYVMLEGIGHGSSDSETMLRMMKIIEGFLSKHMKTEN